MTEALGPYSHVSEQLPQFLVWKGEVLMGEVLMSFTAASHRGHSNDFGVFLFFFLIVIKRLKQC